MGKIGRTIIVLASAALASGATGQPSPTDAAKPSPMNNPAVVRAGDATPGEYQCSDGLKPTMKLTFVAKGRYAKDGREQGTYAVRPSGQMEFVTGPLVGFFASVSNSGRIGLSRQPDNIFFSIGCTLLANK